MPLSPITHSSIICRDRRAIVIWLGACLLLLIFMVMMGGYTRLSGSGLSITEWKPIHGAIPPMGAEEWQEEFDGYRASPQYEQINRGMTLDEFKSIYWPEYFHRLLGRFIGLVFFVPWVIFGLRKSMSRRFSLRLFGIFLLGGLQGAVGWVMVASGLIEGPYVSHIKLALHLMLAFLIIALILWSFLDVLAKFSQTAKTRYRSVIYYEIWFAALVVQIALGALLAGLHGGLIYNTWPTMNGEWIPDALWNDRITLLQFLHRKLAVIVATGFLFWWYLQRKHVNHSYLGKAAAGVTAVVLFQFALGVLTLLYHVPLPLALAHQMTGLLLFLLSVILLHGLVKTKDRTRHVH